MGPGAIPTEIPRGDPMLAPPIESEDHSGELSTTEDHKPTESRKEPSPLGVMETNLDLIPELVSPSPIADTQKEKSPEILLDAVDRTGVEEPLSEPSTDFLPALPLALPVIVEESDAEGDLVIPENQEEFAEPTSLTDSLVGSIDLAADEPMSDPNGKSNSEKPTETPPPPYSRTPKSDSSPESLSPTTASQLDEDDALLLAENAVLAESPLPVEASAPVVSSPHNTPPPASPTDEVMSAAKPPKPPGPAPSKD